MTQIELVDNIRNKYSTIFSYDIKDGKTLSAISDTILDRQKAYLKDTVRELLQNPNHLTNAKAWVNVIDNHLEWIFAWTLMNRK